MKATGVFDTWRDDVVLKLDDANAVSHVQRWFEGRGLPVIDNYTEGHTWLLEAIKDIPSLQGRLATITSELIKNYLDHRVQSGDPTRLLFNLFYFCAGLRQPAILWQPLLRTMKEEAVPATEDDSGEYEGVPLIGGLRAALAGNQADAELRDIWYAMLEDHPHHYLRGTPTDGLEGVMQLPEPPSETVMGWSLARMSDYLDDNPFRLRQFEELLEGVKARFSNPSWDFELLAARCEWKPWAQKLVGDPAGLVHIAYANIDKVEYWKGSEKPRIKIVLPKKYKGANVDSTIRQFALDFCKAPPPDGTLVPAIEHLLPPDKRVLDESKRLLQEQEPEVIAQRKGVAKALGPVVHYLRENEVA